MFKPTSAPLFFINNIILSGFTILLVVVSLSPVNGHGMMLDPPSRSSMWRLGFNTPPNYDDNGLYCGGFGVTYNEVNKGRCGECGDEWSLARPRPNDEGGIFGTGLIGRTYYRGQVIQISVNLTTNHLGHFEFKLCSKQSATELVTQRCLDRNPLKLMDGTTRYHVGQQLGLHNVALKLPDRVVCEHCVIQWHYRTGNTWGRCDDGTYGEGCGPQEIFRNCADVAIQNS